MTADEMERAHHEASQWYLTFISIVFGVFFGVWLAPISDVYFKYAETGPVVIYMPSPSPNAADSASPPSHPTPFGPYERASETRPSFPMVKQTFTWFLTGNFLRGAIMFLILICLWWWYGKFLGHVMPAQGFWLYVFDFISLCMFSIAFRMWHHHVLFPVIVVLAATAMLARFSLAWSRVPQGSSARKSINLALIVLVGFMLIGLGAGGGVVYALATIKSSDNDFIADFWPTIEHLIIALLLLGILVTGAAAWITEGPPHRHPRPPLEWTRA